jgi:hypothetical protein
MTAGWRFGHCDVRFRGTADRARMSDKGAQRKKWPKPEGLVSGAGVHLRTFTSEALVSQQKMHCPFGLGSIAPRTGHR